VSCCRLTRARVEAVPRRSLLLLLLLSWAGRAAAASPNSTLWRNLTPGVVREKDRDDRSIETDLDLTRLDLYNLTHSGGGSDDPRNRTRNSRPLTETL